VNGAPDSDWTDEGADTLFVCERGGRQQPSDATERERRKQDVTFASVGMGTPVLSGRRARSDTLLRLTNEEEERSLRRDRARAKRLRATERERRIRRASA
jgi:hypothetical protein